MDEFEPEKAEYRFTDLFTAASLLEEFSGSERRSEREREKVIDRLADLVRIRYTDLVAAELLLMETEGDYKWVRSRRARWQRAVAVVAVLGGAELVGLGFDHYSSFQLAALLIWFTWTSVAEEQREGAGHLLSRYRSWHCRRRYAISSLGDEGAGWYRMWYRMWRRRWYRR